MASVGYELPGYEEYLSDHCMEDNANSRQQYDEYIEELRSEYEQEYAEEYHEPID